MRKEEIVVGQRILLMSHHDYFIKPFTITKIYSSDNHIIKENHLIELEYCGEEYRSFTNFLIDYYEIAP